jgi:hypothetical protein
VVENIILFDIWDSCQFIDTSKTVRTIGKGNCWDNAPIERFFRSLKSERISYYRFKNGEEAKAEILNYISYYNADRIHSSLGYLTPMDYEKEQLLNVAKKSVRFYLTTTNHIGFRWPGRFG